MKRLGIALAVIMFAPALALAHGGGLDKNGCHHDKKAGDYHCHKGELSGKHFKKPARDDVPVVLRLAANEDRGILRCGAVNEVRRASRGARMNQLQHVALFAQRKNLGALAVRQ